MTNEKTEYYINLAVDIFSKKIRELAEKVTEGGHKMTITKFNRIHKRAHYRMVTKLNDANFSIENFEDD